MTTVPASRHDLKRPTLDTVLAAVLVAAVWLWTTQLVVTSWFAWGRHGVHLKWYAPFVAEPAWSMTTRAPEAVAVAVLFSPWLAVFLCGFWRSCWWGGWVGMWLSFATVTPSSLLWAHGPDMTYIVAAYYLPAPIIALAGHWFSMRRRKHAVGGRP